MKINCKNNEIITLSIDYSDIDNACKKLKKTIENNHDFDGMFVILENESDYDFMKLFMSVGLYYHYDEFILDIIEDTLIAYEQDNLMALYIPNDETHDIVSYLTKELEKLATHHNMWDDLRNCSIYRMLYDAQWRYENTIKDDYRIEEDGEEEDGE